MIMPFEGTHDESVEDMYPPVTTDADENPVSDEDVIDNLHAQDEAIRTWTPFVGLPYQDGHRSRVKPHGFHRADHTFWQ